MMMLFRVCKTLRYRGLGLRIHGSVEDTKLSTNKQHSLSPVRVFQKIAVRREKFETVFLCFYVIDTGSTGSRARHHVTSWGYPYIPLALSSHASYATYVLRRCGTMGMCVCFITAGPITKLCAWGEEESGGHVL